MWPFGSEWHNSDTDTETARSNEKPSDAAQRIRKFVLDGACSDE